MTHATAAPVQRSSALDLFKTLLVVGMVSIHVFQLLGRSLPGWMDRVSEGINLITFSGFLLALGIGVGLSRNRARSWRERLVPVAMLLGACWLSSLAFAVLVDRMPLTTTLAIDILTLRKLFGWSEFLASFFALYLLMALARSILIRMATDNLAFALSLGVAFLSTWVVLDAGLPGTATVIGTTRFASFPLIPYLPWFLIGIRIGRANGEVSPWLWLAAALCSALFAWQLYQTGNLPGRFPPTALWIAGPALILLAYWQLSRGLARPDIWPVLLTPGRYVLSFLLLSNLAIFAMRHQFGRPITSVETWVLLSVVLLAAITALRKAASLRLPSTNALARH